MKRSRESAPRTKAPATADVDRHDAHGLVAEVERRLAPLGTPARAQGEKAYLKSDLDFLGVPMQPLRQFAAALLQERPELAGGALRRAVLALWQPRIHELRTVAIELLARRRELVVADLELFEGLLRDARTWAYVDTIATRLVAEVVERHGAEAEVAATLDRWAVDPDFWLRRTAMLALLPQLRRGAGDWPRFVRYADAQLADREFFLRKAIGWILREVGKQRPTLVVEFLAPRLARTSALTLREAVKYLPEEAKANLRGSRMSTMTARLPTRSACDPGKSPSN